MWDITSVKSLQVGSFSDWFVYSVISLMISVQKGTLIYKDCLLLYEYRRKTKYKGYIPIHTAILSIINTTPVNKKKKK